jgi:hypothetical protein
MRDGHCPKCHHNRILHIREVADTRGAATAPPDIGEASPGFKQGFYDPWRIARVENPKRGFLNQQDGAVGLVEAYVCRACGFTELFTREPDRIPVDGEQVAEIVGS